MVYMLGKKAPRIDDRTMVFKAMFISKVLPAVPLAWNIDINVLGKYKIPPRMYYNDRYGDCVMAGRANQTVRFECFEQSKIITIMDKEVLAEYMKETGGQDSGLVMLDAMNAWRKGWAAAGKKYNIYAFAKLNKNNLLAEMRVAVRYLMGVQVGVALPNNWQQQLDAGQPWHIVPGSAGKPNPNNGHCIFGSRYDSNAKMFYFKTWGVEQAATEEWVTKCADEAYGIVDDKDAGLKSSPVDPIALDAYLNNIAA